MKPRALVGWMVIGLLTGAIGLGYFRPLDGWRLCADSLKYSLPLAALVTLKAGRQGKQRWAVLVLALLALVPLLIGLESIVNGQFDSAAPTGHLAKVVSAYFTTSPKSGTSYYAKVESWRHPGRFESLSISRQNFRRIAQQTPKPHMLVVTKPGRLGFQWIVAMGVVQQGAGQPQTAASPPAEGSKPAGVLLVGFAMLALIAFAIVRGIRGGDGKTRAAG